MCNDQESGVQCFPDCPSAAHLDAHPGQFIIYFSH